MGSGFERELQQHLTRYLGGAETLAEFENWFAPALWDIDEENEIARSQAGAVHLLLAELSRGDLTLDDFRIGLAAMVPDFHFIPN